MPYKVVQEKVKTEKVRFGLSHTHVSAVSQHMHAARGLVDPTFTKRMWEKTSIFVRRYWSCVWRAWNCSSDLVNSARMELHSMCIASC